MPDLLFFLLLGHYFGDFAFQSDRVAQNKGTSKRVLTYHVSIYVLTIALFLAAGLLINDESGQLFRWFTAIALIFLFAQHWVQDFAKGKWFNGTKQGFYVDQALHLLFLFAIRILVYNG